MGERVVWDWYSEGGVVARWRWLGDRELAVHGSRSVARLLHVWFRTAVRQVPRETLAPQHVQQFAQHLVRRAGGAVRPLSEGAIPEEARWLLAVDADRLPALGVRDPFGWGSNRWAPGFDLEWLRAKTAAGVVCWSRGEARGFKAGGRCGDTSELWLTLDRCGRDLVLAQQHRRGLVTAVVVERTAWVRHGPLQRTWRWLEAHR